MIWSDERIETLRRLWMEGHSAGQIATQLDGISRSAVIGKVHRLKLPVRMTVVARPNPMHRKRNSDAPRRVKPATVTKSIAAAPTTKRLPCSDKVAGPDAEGVRRLRSRAWEALAGTAPVGLLDHTSGCRWPITGPGGETLFCNGEAPGKGPYCATHERLAAPVRSHHLEVTP